MDKVYPVGGDQPRIRAKLTNKSVDYLHNDLSNAAHFFVQRINDGFAAQERADGLFLDMMAAATMIAYSLEGYSNFLAERVVGESWNEGASVVEKLKAIRKALAIDVDWNVRPYATAKRLIRLRNMLAHPGAHKADPAEFEAVGTDSELQALLRSHKPEYETLLTQEFVNNAYEDVEAIWLSLLEAAGIKQHETWSGGPMGIEFIAHVKADGPGQ
jgi:hypothetical protein